jgi:NAD(P)-dependent dehydrogenase (short-subunit alcohol dehydrogenase family)
LTNINQSNLIRLLQPKLAEATLTGRVRMSATRRTVIITGASSGIGRATALRLAKSGWWVFAAVRKDSDAQALIAEAGGTLEAVKLDLDDHRSITTAAHDVEARLGGRGLDGLFNNAGTGLIGPIEHLNLAALRQIYEVNLFGQIAMIQAFLPLVRKTKGRIINTCSVGDHLTPPFGGAIASPKAALASMTGALRLELRPQGIHVIIIEPGSITTPTIEKTLGNVEKTIAALSPEAANLYGEAMRRMVDTFARSERAGSPPDVVAAAVERALTDRNPKTRYPAGKDSRKLITLSWLLPERLLDAAVLKTFGLPTSFDKPVK